ncbi:MAG: hypothetical protein V4550_01795 [Gemmatimonadota bacterium]
MDRIRSHSRAVVGLALIALASACRDKAPAPTDSSLAQDLAMAQRNAVTPTVFNDAPLGAPAPASRTNAAPTPKPEPPRAKAPTPRPSPRRESPPAPVRRSPDPSPPQPVAVTPEPTPAPAPAAPAPGIIGAGSRVGMSTNTKVCTANLLPGDKFSATVTSGTTGSNGASIPAGATVVLEVASIDKADPIEQSQIVFRVRSIDVNGEAQPVSGDVANLGRLEGVQTSSGNDRNKVIGGAVAGALLGRILGKSTKATVIGAAAGAAAGTVAAKRGQSSDACLPEGSPLRLTISRDIAVRRAGTI